MSKTGIPCKLSGTDGNAFGIIGRVIRALRTGGDDAKALIEPFKEEAMSGDYDHVIQTAMEYVEIF